MPEEECSTPNRKWFCLRTQTKREHIAAAILGQLEAVEVFCPRIRQIKKTRTGKKRFVEALFPSYLFAKFDYETHSRQVVYSQGVRNMVQLGERRVIPEHVVQELKASLPADIVEAVDPSIEPGAEIEFLTGSLKGLDGKVLAQLPAKNRIQVLLDFLGREITVNVHPDSISLARDPH